MEYSEIIGKRILDLCQKRKITVNKLSTMAGVTQSTVDGIVRGTTKNPKLKTLHKLAIGLSMTLAELLDFKELNDFTFESLNRKCNSNPSK